MAVAQQVRIDQQKQVKARMLCGLSEATQSGADLAFTPMRGHGIKIKSEDYQKKESKYGSSKTTDMVSRYRSF
jgi:hypothetical protein